MSRAAYFVLILMVSITIGLAAQVYYGKNKIRRAVIIVQNQKAMFTIFDGIIE